MSIYQTKSATICCDNCDQVIAVAEFDTQPIAPPNPDLIITSTIETSSI